MNSKFGYLKRLILQATFFVLLILSCNNREEFSDHAKPNIPIYSVDEIGSKLSPLTVDTTEIFDRQDFFAPYFLELFPQKGFLVTADRSEKAIHLFSESGNHLGKAGGEGRGPGEYKGSIKLHAGSDDYLYTYDSVLRRISRFKVDQSGFSLVDTHSPTLKSLTWLRDIYVTEWGNYGVLQELAEIGTREEMFHLYKLDDDFNQVEHLLTMPGNEKMPLNENEPFIQYIDHMVGHKTLWDLDGELFYYVSSHDPIINTYNLRTGELLSKAYFDIEDREVTEEVRNQLREYSANTVKRFPTVKEEMESVQVLPIFEEFVAHDGMLYLMLFDISKNKDTEIIRMNKETEKLHYLRILSNIKRIDVDDEKLYGIKVDEEDFSSIQVFKLGEP